jgi:peptidoglycan/LPS O-acetylase OafA/YrhL
MLDWPTAKLGGGALSEQRLHRSLSTYLNLMRVAAALVVFLYHASYPSITDGVLHHFGYLANDMVMAFFVLSGFVIAYVADSGEDEPATFIKARLARLYSVALPALALTVLADSIGRSLNPDLYDSSSFQGSHPIARLLANAAFLNQVWFLNVRPFSNGPYWSIGYEFWYYMLFACAHFLRGRSRIIGVAALCCAVGPKILLLFPIWLLGAITYRLSRQTGDQPLLGAALFLLSLAAYAALWHFHYRSQVDDRVDAFFHALDLQMSFQLFSKYVVGLAVAMNILGFSMMQRLVDFGHAGRPIQWLAGMTFSIYLFHYPLLHLFAAILPVAIDPRVRAFLLIGLVLGMIALLAAVTERQKKSARLLVDRTWTVATRIIATWQRAYRAS